LLVLAAATIAVACLATRAVSSFRFSGSRRASGFVSSDVHKLSANVREHPWESATDALIFPGVKGGPLRRSNFNKMSARIHAVRAIGAEGLHFHDLWHTGNHFAAAISAAAVSVAVGSTGTLSTWRPTNCSPKTS